MYFVLLVIEKTTGIIQKRGTVLNIFKWVYTIFFVVIGWVIFRAETLHDAFLYLRSIFGLNRNPFSDGMFTGWFTQNVILLIIGAFLCTPVIKHLSEKAKDNIVVRVLGVIGLCCLCVLSMASLVSNSYNPFIYFNF